MRCRLLVLVSLLLLALPAVAAAGPVANSDALYSAFGRVFPDPQGGVCATAGIGPCSPHAQGRVPALTFLGFGEFEQGLRYLNSRSVWQRYLEVLPLSSGRFPGNGRSPEFTPDAELRLGGDADDDARPRQARALHRARHRRERPRQRTSSATCCRCRSTASSAPASRAACARSRTSSPRPRRPSTASRASSSRSSRRRTSASRRRRSATCCARRSSTSPSPTPTAGGAATPTSTAASTSSATTATASTSTATSRTSATRSGATRRRPSPRAARSRTCCARSRVRGGPFAAGDDLHGQLGADSFSYTLLPHGSHDFAKNARLLQAAKTINKVQSDVLSWSPLIAPGDQAAGACAESRGSASACLRVPGQTFGTVYDTIQYTVDGRDRRLLRLVDRAQRRRRRQRDVLLASRARHRLLRPDRAAARRRQRRADLRPPGRAARRAAVRVPRARAQGLRRQPARASGPTRARPAFPPGTKPQADISRIVTGTPDSDRRRVPRRAETRRPSTAACA